MDPCVGANGGAADGGSLVVVPADASSPSDSTATGDAPVRDGQPVQSEGSLDAISSDASSASDATATEDAGRSDAGGSAMDSGPTDASDGSFGDAGATVSFANPVSIDVHALLVSNTVVTTMGGGIPLTTVDGTAGDDFPTQSVASARSAQSPPGIGLPDNAFFPSTGQNIPAVQLAWTNARNVANSVIIPSRTGMSGTVAFAVPPGKYDQLQIYAMATNVNSTLTVTLTYATGNPALSTVTLPDWCTGAPLSGEYTLTRVQRMSGGALDNMLCSIFAVDLNPDPRRVLKSVAFVAQGTTSNGTVVFYGATAW